MKNNKTVWIMILVFVLLIGGAYVLYNQLGSRMDMPQLATQSGQAQDEAGDNQAEAGESEDKAESALAPDFTVYDLNGNPVKLSDYRGKPVVLNFWSSRCGPCQMEMPEFNAAYERLGGEVTFLMVHEGAAVDDGKAKVQDGGYTFPVVFDVDGYAGGIYGVTAYPTTFFISADGNLQAYYMGAMDAALLQQGIDLIYTA